MTNDGATFAVYDPKTRKRRTVRFRYEAAGSNIFVVGAVCSVLLWADTLLLPRGTRDSVGIPVNLLTSAGWGLGIGLLLSRVRRRRSRGS